jgi:cysteine peptidase B
MGGKTSVAWISGHHDLPHDEQAMAEWLSTGGPVSIAVDATSWQTYQGGVMTNCQATQVDHGVLAVGYDLTAQPPYWIIKNSWGPLWGESGYIRIEFGQNECLITTVPSSSVASSSRPPAPPSPPSPPSPPTPPSPSTGSFTQYVCQGALCMSDCQKHSLPTGQCLSLTSGGSAIATCGQALSLQVFQSQDCTGASQTESQPLNECLQDTSGTYIYNTCSSSAVSVSGNVTLARRH